MTLAPLPSESYGSMLTRYAIGTALNPQSRDWGAAPQVSLLWLWYLSADPVDDDPPALANLYDLVRGYRPHCRLPSGHPDRVRSDNGNPRGGRISPTLRTCDSCTAAQHDLAIGATYTLVLVDAARVALEDYDLGTAHARRPSASLRTVRPRLTLLSRDSPLSSDSLRSLGSLRPLGTRWSRYALLSLGSLWPLRTWRSLWSRRSKWPLFSLGPLRSLGTLFSLWTLLALDASRSLSAGVTLNTTFSEGSLGAHRSLGSLRSSRSTGVSSRAHWTWFALIALRPLVSLWPLRAFGPLWTARVSLGTLLSLRTRISLNALLSLDAL